MKESRHRIILQELDQTGVVAVKNLKEMLGVTDMTIRRDLIDLEKQGMLTRVHGGAHKKVKNALNEISHSEKQMLNVEEKKQIARKCADLIADGDTVFIGSGTTTDFIGDYLDGKNISIVTNSLPIFEKLKERANLDLILIGGRYRAKAFIGANGIDGHNVTTSNEEEGNGDAIILNNAISKYIVADNSKFDSYSFYSFYRLDNLSAVVTDDNIAPKVKEKYSTYVEIL